jgi:tight adherence protein B
MEIFFKKNNKNTEKIIIENGIDYSDYEMKALDYFVGYMAGFVISFIATHILFERVIFSLIAGLSLGFLAIKIYKKYLIINRQKKLLLQFKDFLESLSASYSAGKNTRNAFKDAFKDMTQLHGDKSYLSVELEIIDLGMENGSNIEDLLNNFASRSYVDDIKSFADIFESGNRTGANMKTIICQTKEIINDKIEIEMEINSMVVQKRTELYIMLAMPFIMILALNTLGDRTFSAFLPINVILRICVLIVVLIAYFIGKKIIDIKV